MIYNTRIINSCSTICGKIYYFYVFVYFKINATATRCDMMYNTNYLLMVIIRYNTPLSREEFYRELFLFDSYINFKVQRIQFYFRLSHALSGLMGYNYFTTPNYPMQGRGYVLGINWRFYD